MRATLSVSETSTLRPPPSSSLLIVVFTIPLTILIHVCDSAHTDPCQLLPGPDSTRGRSHTSAVRIAHLPSGSVSLPSYPCPVPMARRMHPPNEGTNGSAPAEKRGSGDLARCMTCCPASLDDMAGRRRGARHVTTLPLTTRLQYWWDPPIVFRLCLHTISHAHRG